MPDQDEQVDVVVIGMGPGGEEVAGRLAEAGLSVVGVERELVGGECPYWGCVPSKMIIRGANLLAEARRIDKVAGKATVQSDLGLSPGGSATRPPTTGTTRSPPTGSKARVAGWCAVTRKLDGPGRVRVGDDLFTVTRGVVLATGSAPVVPPLNGLAEARHWTNREAISATSARSRSRCSGAGAVGLELAQAFSRFGSQVTVIEAMDRVLPPEEPESSEVVGRVLRARGHRAVARREGDAEWNASTAMWTCGSTTARRYARPSCS